MMANLLFYWWYRRPESNRHDLAIGGFLVHRFPDFLAIDISYLMSHHF